jgi:ornithine--oxo-acid transaminase
VLTPGTHGSTFGGNPLAMAIGREVVAMLQTGEFQARAAEAEPLLRERVTALESAGVIESRVVGMWVGLDIDPELGTGRQLCEALMARGVLAKDTHGSTIRLSPPLTTSDDDLHWAMDRLAEALADLRQDPTSSPL